MTKLTKKQAGMIRQYADAKATNLSDVYVKPSDNKARVYREILHEMIDNDGRDLRIPSANHHHFTLAYQYKNNDGEWRLRYHTYANVYDMPLR